MPPRMPHGLPNGLNLILIIKKKKFKSWCHVNLNWYFKIPRITNSKGKNVSAWKCKRSPNTLYIRSDFCVWIPLIRTSFGRLKSQNMSSQARNNRRNRKPRFSFSSPLKSFFFEKAVHLKVKRLRSKKKKKS